MDKHRRSPALGSFRVDSIELSSILQISILLISILIYFCFIYPNSNISKLTKSFSDQVTTDSNGFIYNAMLNFPNLNYRVQKIFISAVFYRKTTEFYSGLLNISTCVNVLKNNYTIDSLQEKNFEKLIYFESSRKKSRTIEIGNITALGYEQFRFHISINSRFQGAESIKFIYSYTVDHYVSGINYILFVFTSLILISLKQYINSFTITANLRQSCYCMIFGVIALISSFPIHYIIKSEEFIKIFLTIASTLLISYSRAFTTLNIIQFLKMSEQQFKNIELAAQIAYIANFITSLFYVYNPANFYSFAFLIISLGVELVLFAYCVSQGFVSKSKQFNRIIIFCLLQTANYFLVLPLIISRTFTQELINNRVYTYSYSIIALLLLFCFLPGQLTSHSSTTNKMPQIIEIDTIESTDDLADVPLD